MKVWSPRLLPATNSNNYIVLVLRILRSHNRKKQRSQIARLILIPCTKSHYITLPRKVTP